MSAAEVGQFQGARGLTTADMVQKLPCGCAAIAGMAPEGVGVGAGQVLLDSLKITIQRSVHSLDSLEHPSPGPLGHLESIPPGH